jgi:thymidylate synthase (FAD)
VKPYAELLEYNQPNPIRKRGFTRIRDAFPGLADSINERIEPGMKFELTTNITYDPERIMEFAGRWDYGENNARKLGETVVVNAPELAETPTLVDGQLIMPPMPKKEVPIIQKYIGMGHESMIEMGEATFFIECSRIVSLEFARHRHQERQEMSQRFVKFGEVESIEDLFIRPPGINDREWAYIMTQNKAAYQAYLDMRSAGVSPQDARYVLPGGFITKMIVKMNIRAWRHVLKLRLDKSAQPEMRELMQQVYDQLVDVFPNAMHGVLDGGRGVR